ncbi:AAA family ATPase, partial [Mycobacterium tuberculosis]|nr:AAA family ATPase [Mycobacterium tuberculosis]
LGLYLEERAAAGDRVDYVIIDCPPSLGLLTVNAFVSAREVLIPIQCEYYALEGLSQLLKNIQLIQKHLNPQPVAYTHLTLPPINGGQIPEAGGPSHQRLRRRAACERRCRRT